jgi:sec-independent protein translocase protein TatC
LAPFILEFLTKPVPQVITLAPAEAFVTRLKLAIVLGLFAALPFVLWQIWSFVVPMLPMAERRGGFVLVPVAFILFMSGASFCFFLVIPFALKFFMSFATPDLVAKIAFQSLISFAVGMVVPFGLIFEMPVVAYFLAKVGVLRPGPLAKNRKFAFFAVVVLAAFITPTPDMFNMSLMAGPMYLLYEISILVSALVWRGKRKRQAAAGTAA